MNLIIVSIFIMGVLAVAYSVVYTLVYERNSALWWRIIALILFFGGYVGLIAIFMLLIGMPLS